MALSVPSLDKYAMQCEVCPDTGREHVQGWITFRVKIRPFTYFKSTHGVEHGVIGDTNSIHWAKQKAKMDGPAYRYCVKEDTAIPGTRRCNFKIPIAPRVAKSDLEGVELYTYQKEVIDLFETEPDKRKVYWYWESVGNSGKSSLVTHMLIENKERACKVSGKGSDIKFAFCKFIEKYEDCRMVLVDIPRSQKNKVSYETIEEIKNKSLFSGKYESNGIVFPCPHVVVFANFPPDTTKLSSDRWVIKEIKDPLIVGPREEF